MSINLITGATFDAVTHKVYDDIRANDERSGKHIVIVPDQFALMSEKETLEYLNIKSSFNIEVLSFSRFAVKVLNNKINKSLNQYTSVMLLKKLAIDNYDKLKCFGAVAKKNGYINELYATITNIRNSNIKPSTIVDSLPKLNGILKSKAEDIAMLYDEYNKQLASNYSDIGSCLEQLAEAIPNIEWISRARFYITDFNELSKIKLNIVTAICRNALSTTIGIAYDENAQNLQIQPKNLVDYVYAMAKKYSIAVERNYAWENLPKEKTLIACNLFGHNLQTRFTDNSIYEIYTAESIEHEIKSVARLIRRNVIGGYKYKDIAVICSNTSTVKDIISREFSNFDIPYYMDIKADFYTNAVCRIFAKAIAVIEKNFTKSAVLAFVKEGLFNASCIDKNIFTQFVAKYNINYAKFTEKFTIGTNDKHYPIAEKVRNLLTEYVGVLQIESNDVTEIIGRIKKFYLSIFADNNLHNYVESLKRIGENLNAEITELCVKKVANLLDNTQEIFAENKLNSEEVYNILLSAFESVKVSMIPQYVDNVFIGTANKSKLSETKILYVIGANDGAYPNTQSDSSVLNQSDLDKLSLLNILISPTAKDKYGSEKFFIMQTLLKGTDKVIITYSAGAEKSLLVEQLIRILGICTSKLISNASRLHMTESDYATKLGTYENAKIELMRYYGERFNGVHLADENVYDYVQTKLIEQGEKFNFSKEKMHYNVHNYSLQWSKKGDKTFARISAVETFFKCPFKFYVQNVLKLKEQYSAEITHKDIGVYIHRMLELFFSRQKNYNLPNKKIKEIVEKYTMEVFNNGEFLSMQYLMDEIAVQKQLVERCVYTIKKLCNNQLRSKCDIAECEFTFGMEDSKFPPLELVKNGKKYNVRGVIDRIDKYNDYIAVIDYKTASGIDVGISDLFNGTRAQLLLYLNAYAENSDDRPLAAMYMALPYKYSDDSKDDGYYYSGFLRNLEQGIEALDKNYLAKNTFLPIKTSGGKKSDNVALDNKSVYTQKEFKLFMDYAKAVTAQAIEDIDSGYIAPRPINCNYCEYGNICKEFDNLDLRRKIPKVELERETITEEII